MSLALYPSIRLGKTEQKIRESISRLSTGLNVLAGATGGDFAQATGLKLEANSYKNLPQQQVQVKTFYWLQNQH